MLLGWWLLTLFSTSGSSSWWFKYSDIETKIQLLYLHGAGLTFPLVSESLVRLLHCKGQSCCCIWDCSERRSAFRVQYSIRFCSSASQRPRKVSHSSCSHQVPQEELLCTYVMYHLSFHGIHSYIFVVMKSCLQMLHVVTKAC